MAQEFSHRIPATTPGLRFEGNVAAWQGVEQQISDDSGLTLETSADQLARLEVIIVAGDHEDPAYIEPIAEALGDVEVVVEEIILDEEHLELFGSRIAYDTARNGLLRGLRVGVELAAEGGGPATEELVLSPEMAGPYAAAHARRAALAGRQLPSG